MRILVTGAAGMLGSSVCPWLRKCGNDVRATDIQTVDPDIDYLDVRDHAALEADILGYRPQLVLHLAAETDVERCELEPDHAYLTNTVGTQNVALLCRGHEVPMVYISTAGVFDGEKQDSYHEFDPAHPLNVYGKSKLEGERIVERLVARSFIVRAGWMIGGGRKDKKFIMKIIRQVDAGKTDLHVVDDKLGTPTYTADFARCLYELVQTPYYGRYHMACKGSGTRYDVAVELLRFLGRDDIRVHRVGSEHFQAEYFAPRPRSEMMRNMMLDLRGLNLMRDWRVALAEYLQLHFADRRRAPLAGVAVGRPAAAEART